MFRGLKRVWLLSLLVTAILVTGCLVGPRSHELTIAVQGEGTVTPAEGTHSVRHNAAQDLLAEPADGWQFGKWVIESKEGGRETQERETSIYVDQEKHVIAVFTKIEEPPVEDEPTSYTLTVKVQGNGNVTPNPGTHDFSEGEAVELKAEPGEDCTFEGWFIVGADGTVEKAEEEISITMTEDKEVTAVFSTAGCPAQTVNHILIVETSGDGTVTPNPGTHEFEENEEVSLQAEPADGWNFFHWVIEDETETKEYDEQNISIKMTGRIKAIAVFAKPLTPPTSYRIRVDREGEGIITPWKGTRFLRRNEEVNLQAEPALGWEFKEWIIEDEDGTSQLSDENISFKMERDIDVTAIFVKALAPTSYTLTINVEGEGTVTPAIGTHEFLENKQAELAADPAAGWEFVKWIVDGTEHLEENISFEMDGNKEAKAVFKEIAAPASYTLTVNVEGEGTVTPAIGTHEFSENEQAELTANPAEGWEFTEWIIEDENGTEKLQDKNISLRMNSDKSVKALFTAGDTYTLTIRIIGEGSTELSEGEHQVPAGPDVRIPPYPADGWEHYGWIVERPGDVNEVIQGSRNWGGWKDSSLPVSMNDDIVVTVVFAKDFSELTMEHAYIVESTPNEGSDLRVTNQTDASTGKKDSTYPVGYPVRIETLSGRSDAPTSNDRFEGWSIRSTASGEELNPEEYFADYKERVTTVRMPEEDVTITAEWIKFAHIFGEEQGQRGTRVRSTEDDARHYFDLSHLPTGTGLTFGFHPRAVAAVRYKVYYGTWEDLLLAQPRGAVFNTGWVSTDPKRAREELAPYDGKIEDRMDWHEAVELDTEGAVYKSMIEKRSGDDYVLVIVERPQGDSKWRYSLQLDY